VPQIEQAKKALLFEKRSKNFLSVFLARAPDDVPPAPA
jgi:hypothetical protein